ncbi:MAG: Maf family protein [Pseudomonadota bacterium]
MVLGSASPRRRELLAQIGVVPDRVEPADIDETYADDELPRRYAERLAREKAAAVVEKLAASDSGTGPDTLILCADTVVSAGRRILDKPSDLKEARRSLQLLSGRRHRVNTAFCLLRLSDRQCWERRVEAQVRMKRLSAEEIERYLDSGEWQGKAGGYAIQGMAAAFVPWISGSYSGIVGLPLAEVAGALTAAGYQLSGLDTPL